MSTPEEKKDEKKADAAHAHEAPKGKLGPVGWTILVIVTLMILQTGVLANVARQVAYSFAVLIGSVFQSASDNKAGVFLVLAAIALAVAIKKYNSKKD